MTAPRPAILLVDDRADHAETLADALEALDAVCDIATGGREALDRLSAKPYDLVITDLKMADLDGMELLREAKGRSPDTEVIVVTGYATVENAVAAMQQGAATYLRKPVNLEELRAVVRSVLEKQALRRTNAELRRELDQRYGFEGIIGNNPKMLRLVETLRQIAPTDATVLIYGESGTGKELVARAIHNNSPRRAKRFVALNCAALSEGILESELFGHEKGSFTGAAAARQGRFEYADGGTLLLDEVGDMPASTQVKLLRVLEQNEIVRVGSNAPIHVDVRIVAATHRRLETLIKEGKFREDLYFRLKVVTLYIPPLRERPDDIPLLADHFLREIATAYKKSVTEIAPDARRRLAAYEWPGNVRELRNAIEHMVVVTTDPVLGADDLPDHIAPGEAQAAEAPPLVGISIEHAERELIRNTLAAVGGNRVEAAKTLGIGERTLYRKIKEYDLK
ncbi:MAG TPA: sigma-54 dependent transcriptional regulator [Planctomycetota bacterium]|nr:sigma-54 dependent transcriptional regulator [Planctomycetota bacterium]HRR80917.1 sigma-54 dependent transcriptional regulator [Planctomycetota bacterium]HRT93859.1 sigma-54 dependent transcriptional regulator [Planctomycetota bacterium]